jgi:hypothetical protein
MKKLNLKDLKVQSFVTSLEKNEKQTVKGGWPVTVDCNTKEFDICQKASESFIIATDVANFITCNRNE